MPKNVAAKTDLQRERLKSLGGFVYVIAPIDYDPKRSDYVRCHTKVGIAIDPAVRLTQIYSNFPDMKIYLQIGGEGIDVRGLEKAAHRALGELFQKHKAEWFGCSPYEAISMICEILPNHFIEPRKDLMFGQKTWTNGKMRAMHASDIADLAARRQEVADSVEAADAADLARQTTQD